MNNPLAPAELEAARALRIARQNIRTQKLDLNNLTIYTEAATGTYAYTACIAALAGARVYALAGDNKWATADQSCRAVEAVARAWNVEKAITLLTQKREAELSRADIITNSGNVRPVDAPMIRCLKPGAVVCLMWETFEWRPEEVDLQACRASDILVMGTDEAKLDFFPFAAESTIKMMHECGLAVHHSVVLGLGSGPIMRATLRRLKKNGAEVALCGYIPEEGDTWISPDSTAALHDMIARCDVILCDERESRRPLIAEEGLVSAADIARLNPSCVIINRHGVVDTDGITSCGLMCRPSARTASWQTPHYTTAILGIRPVIELMTAGLRVGEVMARCRLRGMDVVSTAYHALRHSAAQDFPPPFNLLSENAQKQHA